MAEDGETREQRVGGFFPAFDIREPGGIPEDPGLGALQRLAAVRVQRERETLGTAIERGELAIMH